MISKARHNGDHRRQPRQKASDLKPSEVKVDKQGPAEFTSIYRRREAPPLRMDEKTGAPKLMIPDALLKAAIC